VIGLDVDAQTSAQLQRLADAADGVYYDARSEEDLNNALGAINETILPTTDSPVVVDATATSAPEPNAQIASEGEVSAASVYDENYLPELVLDGDLSTSWFSSGPDGDGTTTFVWTGVQEDYIASIDLISNRDHAVFDFRTGYGFGQVVVQVYNAADELVYEETVSLDGMPDPDVHVEPNVVGQWIWLVFTGHEANDCGGFAELYVNVVR